MGNGGFKLSYRMVGDKVTIVRNENYWNSKDIYIEKANFFSIVDQNTEYSHFEAGQIDVTSRVPYNQFKNIKAKYATELRTAPFFSCLLLYV